MSLFVSLLVAAVAIGVLHMLAPDHWVPLMAVSSSMKYSRRRTYLTAALLGLLHAGASVAVALLALLLGVFLVGGYLSYLFYGGEVILLAVGIYFIVGGFLEKPGPGKVKFASVGSLLSVSIFPDLAVLPILLTGVDLGKAALGIIMLSFTLVSVISLSVMSAAASMGLTRGLQRVPPRFIDYIMGAILIGTAGALMLAQFV